jgi:hypothetical protein
MIGSIDEVIINPSQKSGLCRSLAQAEASGQASSKEQKGRLDRFPTLFLVIAY